MAKPSATGDVLDVDQFQAGLPQADDQLTSMYAARWAAASDLERQILAVMAQTATPTVTRAEIASRLGRPTQALGVPRERLIDKGIIEPANRGEVRFTMPGFDRYIRETLATGASADPGQATAQRGAGRRRRELPPRPGHPSPLELPATCLRRAASMSAPPRKQHRGHHGGQVIDQLADVHVLQLPRCAVGVPLPTAAASRRQASTSAGPLNQAAAAMATRRAIKPD